MVDVPDVGGNVVVGGVDERLVQVHQQHQLPALDQSTKYILLSLIFPHCFLSEQGRRTLISKLRIQSRIQFGFGSYYLLKFFHNKFALLAYRQYNQ